jgi:hypothetical protein
MSLAIQPTMNISVKLLISSQQEKDFDQILKSLESSS